MSLNLALVLVLSCSLFASTFAVTPECSYALKGLITDNAQLDAAMSRARTKFMESRPHPFNRLASVLLVLQPDGSFLRGSFNATQLAYPASTVKLNYLVAGIEWCKQQRLPPTCLRHAMGPMIGISSNFDTGLVVDFITGAPNIWTMTTNTTPGFSDWINKRNFTQRFLESRGLLENMVVLHKTYPTNSGSDPVGAEQVARQVYGMNQMCPKCAASIMAEIVVGKMHLDARDYMLDLLLHDQYGDYTTFGSGLPPGTVMYTKIGNAYDTLEEISYIILPNGKRIILTAYSNGYVPSEPNLSSLAAFAGFVLEEAGLTDGLPQSIILEASLGLMNPKLVGGVWQAAAKNDQYGKGYVISSNATAHAIFTFVAPKDALYNVAVWYPESPANTNTAGFQIQHRDGTLKVSQNLRQLGGRWNTIANVNMIRDGTYQIDVSNLAPSAGLLAVDAVRITAWPDCRGIPGSACLSAP